MVGTAGLRLQCPDHCTGPGEAEAGSQSLLVHLLVFSRHLSWVEVGGIFRLLGGPSSAQSSVEGN